MKIIQKIQSEIHNLILAKKLSIIVNVIDPQGVLLVKPFLIKVI